MESSGRRRFELIEAFGSLLSSPGEFALDEAFLIMSSALGSGFDVMEHLVSLDELASEVSSPTVEGIARHLFSGPNPFIGNSRNYYDPNNSLLDQVLRRRTGIPITLAVVMIEVGRRLGVHLVGVGLPGHFLVGTSAKYGKVPEKFVDPFHGGEILDIDGCRRLYDRMTGHSNFDRNYAAAVHPIAIVDRALNNLRSIFIGARNDDKLRTLMSLRSRLPGLGAVERDELFRMMAPFN